MKFITFFRKKNVASKQMEDALKNWNKRWKYPIFPYPWANEYKPEKFLCKKDTDCGLFFIEWQGEKLYFSKNYETEESVQYVAACFLLEQDLLSPHRYVTKENKMFGAIERPVSEILDEIPFFVEKGDIVADIGGSNGNFSISVIENAKHIYLFEADEIWDEPLRKTFEKYKDKITVVKKYVSDTDSDDTVTLDTFFKDKEINFIKIDIDGYEEKLLNGAKNILERKNVKFSICTYHKPNDAQDFNNLFRELGYKTYFVDGYMFFPFIWADNNISLYDSLQNISYFRKGILRARND